MEIKKIILDILSILFYSLTFAKSVPQGINYQANPYESPNFFVFFLINSYVGQRPTLRIYNFIYHNLEPSSDTALQITKISNP